MENKILFLRKISRCNFNIIFFFLFLFFLINFLIFLNIYVKKNKILKVLGKSEFKKSFFSNYISYLEDNEPEVINI